MKTVATLIFSLLMASSYAQTLYVPNVPSSTGGISTSTIAGNVGIGTASPSDQLEVVSGNRKVGLNTVVSGVTSGGVISLSRPDDGAKLMLVGSSASPADDAVIYGAGGSAEVRFVAGGGSSSGFGFYSNISAAAAFGGTRPTTPIMKLDGSGNLGIGTSSPAFKVDVNGSGSGARFRNTSTTLNAYTTFRIQGANYEHGLEIDFFGNNNFTADSYGGGVGSAAIVNVNPKPLVFGTNNQNRMQIDGSGNVLIGKTTQVNSNYKLDVNGSGRFNEVVVNTTGADFVFEKGYKLKPLQEVEAFIKANSHLPEIASAEEMQKNGVGVGELQTQLLQKIEELTLYMIEMKKENEALKQKSEELANQNKELNKRVFKLEEN